MTEYNLGIVLAVIIAVGLLGNAASIVVLLRGKRCRKLFCSTYLLALAAIDTAILALPALELCLYLLFDNFLLRSVNQLMCKFLTFFLFYGEQLSSWIVVGVSVARALSIWMPIRSQTWRNKTTIPYLVIVAVVFLVVDLPFLIDAERATLELDKYFLRHIANLLNITELEKLLNIGNTTMGSNRSSQINFTDLRNLFGGLGNQTIEKDDTVAVSDQKTYDFSFCLLTEHSIYGEGKLLKPIMVDFCLVFAIPLCIITICNFSIIVRLIKSMRQIKKTQGCQTNIKDTRMISLTLRIFVLSTVHLISTGPVAVAEVLKASSIDSTVFFKFKSIAVYRAFNLLFYLNSGVNFVLYCLFGNEFRQDMYDILRLKRKRIREIS